MVDLEENGAGVHSAFPENSRSDITKDMAPLPTKLEGLEIIEKPKSDDKQKAGYSTWLHRLFESEFFNSRMALQYLYRYPEVVGTQYGTCEELKKFKDEDIIFLLPQLCHMLVTQRSLTFALENFLLNRCLRRPHFAVLLLWQLEGYLLDYAPFPLSREYLLLKRIYHTIQALLMLDAPEHSGEAAGGTSPLSYHANQSQKAAKSTTAISRLARLAFYKRKPTFSVKAALIGASIEAGAPVFPALSTSSRDMIRSELGGPPPSLELIMSMAGSRDGSIHSLPGHRRITSSHVFSFSRRGSGVSSPPSESGAQTSYSTLPTKTLAVRHSLLNLVVSPSLEELNRGSAFTSGYLIPPNLSKSPSSCEAAREEKLEAVLYSSLLKNQMQFVLALFDICGRLLPIPKPARQAALVAELALLNHNLPANICLPFWCRASENAQACHHKIVRISPEDAVTLNSADRVPYLMFVEIVNPCGDDGVAPDYCDWVGDTPKLAYFPELPSDCVSESAVVPVDESVAEPPVAHVSIDVKSPVSGATSAGSKSPLPLLSPRYSVVSAAAKTAEKPFEAIDKTLTGNRVLSPLNMGITAAPIRPASPVHVSQDSSPRSVKMSRDELDASLRSAAILLAQLHWELEKDKGSVIIYPHSSSSGAASGGGAAQQQTPFRRLSLFLNGQRESAAPAQSEQRPAASGSQIDSATRVIVPGSMQMSSAARSKKMQQIGEIRVRIFKEMMTLEEKRRLSSNLSLSMNVLKNPETLNDGEETRLQEMCARTNQEDPSAQVVQEEWFAKRERIRLQSPFGHLPGWDLLSVIVKGGTDLRQEQLATQLLLECQRIWKRENVPCWVYCFRVHAISSKAGFVDVVKNAISVHSLKKDAYAKRQNKEGLAYTLMDYFASRFGPPGSAGFREAQDNFMRSLAAYSLFCYLFQVKDRHNGNILVDNKGHIIHIDFGFMLSNTPGSVGFEYAPFKLAMDYIDILGGIGSAKWLEFKQLLCQGLLALRKEREALLSLVEMMQKESTLNCFTGFNTSAKSSPVAPGEAVGDKPQSSTGFGFTWFWSGGASAAKKSDSAVSVPAKTEAATLPPAVPVVPTKDNPLMGNTNNSVLPTVALEERFHSALSSNEISELVDKLVESAAGNVYTRLYDTFQYYANGIL